MFAWIRSEIIRIELIVVSLSDHFCAQRGEVSQRETPPLSELSFDLSSVSNASPEKRVSSPLGPRAARKFGGMHVGTLRAIALMNDYATRACCSRVSSFPLSWLEGGYI